MGALQSRPAPWCGAALQIVGGRAIRVPCLSALFCRQSGQTQKADITDIQQLLGHQRPTTTDIYLRSVAPPIMRKGRPKIRQFPHYRLHKRHDRSSFGMPRCKTSAHLSNINRTGRVRLKGVISRTDLSLKPVFDRPVTRHQSAKLIPDNFTLCRILTSLYLCLDHICHLIGQRDAKLLYCWYETSFSIDKIKFC